jgi:competence protein ComGC
MIYLKTFVVVLLLILIVSVIFSLTVKNNTDNKHKSLNEDKDNSACTDCGIKSIINCNK